MARTTPIEFFRETLKSEALVADEVINVYLLRPIAAVLVWAIYPTRITPNVVTLAAIIIGCIAAAVYVVGTPGAVACAGLLVTAKDIVDDADGQLARAKQMYSRRGRFLDSIGDFVVDLALFGALAYAVSQTVPVWVAIILAILGFLGITLRVSYHVFYQVSFLHLENTYKLNRIVEAVTDADRQGDPVAFRLQIVFNALYTWQDRLMLRIDTWSGGGKIGEGTRRDWYSDRIGLRLSGLLGFGTEYAVLTICSLTDHLYLYLWLNLAFMNGIWVASILYRRLILAGRMKVR